MFMESGKMTSLLAGKFAWRERHSANGSFCSDNYAIESLTSISDINNKGQIPCMGSIWGDQFPCLLEPIKKQESLNADLNAFIDSYN